jgi:16S rRNA (cytidine1402-2'-O)-methyltransferase
MANAGQASWFGKGSKLVRRVHDTSETAFKPDLRAIPPGLHFVSTPIGAARDITLRALDVLAGADVLVAEDTRTLRHLMEIHGIALGGRAVIAYHDHSGEGALARLLALIGEGRSVAYASEAGTPLISDPGFELARAVAAAGLPMTAAPGPCAAICALTVSGLPSDRFFFAGFPPSAQSARREFLAGVSAVPATLVLYESPKRLAQLLAEMARTLGGGRQAVICRELTKRFEEISRGTLDHLAQSFADRTVKGEIVVLVDRAAPEPASEDSIGAALDTALSTMSVKVYRIALDRNKG